LRHGDKVTSMTTDTIYEKYKSLESYIGQHGGYDHIIANANLNVTVHNDAFHLFREITNQSFFHTAVRFRLDETSSELRTALMSIEPTEPSWTTVDGRHRSDHTTVEALIYRADGRLRILVPPQFGWKTSVAVSADYGCSHSMKRTNLGRCYNKYACEKCDYSYTVDSGD